MCAVSSRPAPRVDSKVPAASKLRRFFANSSMEASSFPLLTVGVMLSMSASLLPGVGGTS